MGRYDALLEPSKPPAQSIAQVPTQQSQKADPTTFVKKPANPQTHLQASPPLTKSEDDIAKKPANPQARKPANDKPEKYTTRLEPSMIRRIKVFAADKDIKDYEVVKNALVEYFERQK